MLPRLIAVLALTVLALSICGCTTDAAKPGEPQILTPDSRPDVTREAAVDGVVDILSGCFVLKSDGRNWLVEWPYGSEIGTDGQSVEIEEFGTVHVGDRLLGSGGYENGTDGCDTSDLEGTVSIDAVTDAAPEDTEEG